MSNLKFREVIKILETHGFKQIRVKGSHGRYEAHLNGVRQNVTVQVNHPSHTVDTGTLKSIIRQSGLPKSLFGQ